LGRNLKAAKELGMETIQVRSFEKGGTEAALQRLEQILNIRLISEDGVDHFGVILPSEKFARFLKIQFKQMMLQQKDMLCYVVEEVRPFQTAPTGRDSTMVRWRAVYQEASRRAVLSERSGVSVVE